MPNDIIEHLANAYGTKALDVLEYVKTGFTKRLLDGYPYIEAEVAYVLHSEFARNTDDILSRRLRLAFLDQKKAASLRGRIDEIIALC